VTVKYLSARALRLHLTLAVLLPAFGTLFWWQLHRALAGNGLSWAYTVEWPLFAGYAVFLWWRLLHDDLPPRARPGRRAAKGANEGELAAYNAYLASLHEADGRGDGRPPDEPPGEGPGERGPLP